MSNPWAHQGRSMTPQRRARIFAERAGTCQGPCGRKLGPSDKWDIDHVIPLCGGGSDDDDNLQLICEWCHKDKTADDVERHAHGRRAYTRHVVPSGFRRSKAWRT